MECDRKTQQMKNGIPPANVLLWRSINLGLKIEWLNLRHPLCGGEEARKRGIHPDFETQGRRHQKSKTGVSVAPQKGLVSSKNFKKKKKVACLAFMPIAELPLVCIIAFLKMFFSPGKMVDIIPLIL